MYLEDEIAPRRRIVLISHLPTILYRHYKRHQILGNSSQLSCSYTSNDECQCSLSWWCGGSLQQRLINIKNKVVRPYLLLLLVLKQARGGTSFSTELYLCVMGCFIHRNSTAELECWESSLAWIVVFAPSHFLRIKASTRSMGHRPRLPVLWRSTSVLPLQVAMLLGVAPSCPAFM